MSASKDSAKTYPPNQLAADRDLASAHLQQSWSYEETVQQVEDMMARIESGELELADVFDQFATAIESLRQCETFLAERQQQMDLLIETLTDELQ